MPLTEYTVPHAEFDRVIFTVDYNKQFSDQFTDTSQHFLYLCSEKSDD